MSFCPLIKKDCMEDECAWYITTGEGVGHMECVGCAVRAIVCETT